MSRFPTGIFWFVFNVLTQEPIKFDGLLIDIILDLIGSLNN